MSSNSPRRLHMIIALVAVLVAAVLVMVLPLGLPLPLRIAVAGTDLIAAAVVFVYLKQQKP